MLTLAACGGDAIEAPASTSDPAPEEAAAGGTGNGAGAGVPSDEPDATGSGAATADTRTEDATTAEPVTGVPLVDQASDVATDWTCRGTCTSCPTGRRW